SVKQTIRKTERNLVRCQGQQALLLFRVSVWPGRSETEYSQTSLRCEQRKPAERTISSTQDTLRFFLGHQFFVSVQVLDPKRLLLLVCRPNGRLIDRRLQRRELRRPE